MRPLTLALPKPALPLPDGPVVASALRQARGAGATRVVVNCWHLADRMADAVALAGVEGVDIQISFEEELMGTAGGLALARDRGLLGDEGSVLVVNGDVVLGLDLAELFVRHRSSDDLVTLALLPHLDPTRWSRVLLDPDGLVEAIYPPGPPGHREAPFLYPGVMAVRREALDSLEAAPSEVPSTLWAMARAEARLGGVVVTGHWREVGSPTDYLEVMRVRLAGANAVHRTARVDESARVQGSFIGRSVVVSAAARVSSSILAEGARVHRGARVRDSILLGPIEVGTGLDVTGQVEGLAQDAG